MRKNLRKGFLFVLLGLISTAPMKSQIKIEAESFIDSESKSSDIVIENDVSVGYFDEEGEKLIYEVNIPSEGMYQFSFKYVARRDGYIRIQSDDDSYYIYKADGNYEMGDNWWSLSIGNWFEYPFEKGPAFHFTEGTHVITVVNEAASINIDYFTMQKTDITDKEVVKIKTSPSKIEMMPNEILSVNPVGYNEAGQMITAPIKYSSNVTDGKYKAGDYGTDEISITMGGYTKNVPVNITKPTKKRDFVVSKYGFLNTSKGYVGDASGNKVSLMGISYFWSDAAPIGLWWCGETVRALVDQYNVQVLRLAVTISPCGANGQAHCSSDDRIWGGDGAIDNYRKSPEATRKMVDEVVKACIENDIYVIIDFHEHQAQDWVDLSKDFFGYFSSKWGSFPNVMYEIFNEPMEGNDPVVAYAKQIIPVIRANDPKNIIIVGSTQWSREPDGVTAAGDGQTNIAYTWHGYKEYDHQKDWDGKSHWNNGLPIVVTEWGVDGGGNDGGMRSIFKEHGVINCFWSISNKESDSQWSIFKGSCFKKSGWTDNDLNTNGRAQLNACKSWVNFTATEFAEEEAELTMSICSSQKLYLPNESETKVSGSAKGGSGKYTYTWKQTKGESATISSANSAETKISDLKAGVNVFSLTVSDGENQEVMSVTITVYPEGYVDPGLIDDIADNDITTRIGGYWDTFDDSEQKASNPYSSITSPEQLPSNGCIKAEAKMGSLWGGTNSAYCGVDLVLNADKSGMDLSNCNKITYKYKGNSHIFRVEMSEVEDDDYHSVDVPGSDDWTEASINFGSLKQASDWGIDMPFSKTSITKLSWMFRGNENTTRKLEIDDVTCVGMEFPCNTSNVTDAISSKLYLYPNPSENGECTLIVMERCNVTIYDIAGVIVKEFVAIPNFNNNFVMNQKGIYFVKVGDETIKLVVK